MYLRAYTAKSSLIDCPRFRHLVNRLHSLGPRPVGEFIAGLHRRHDNLPIRLLLESHANSDPEIVRSLGADHWPASIVLLGDVKSVRATRDYIMRVALPADGGDDAA